MVSAIWAGLHECIILRSDFIMELEAGAFLSNRVLTPPSRHPSCIPTNCTLYYRLTSTSHPASSNLLRLFIYIPIKHSQWAGSLHLRLQPLQPNYKQPQVCRIAPVIMLPCYCCLRLLESTMVSVHFMFHTNYRHSSTITTRKPRLRTETRRILKTKALLCM